MRLTIPSLGAMKITGTYIVAEIKVGRMYGRLAYNSYQSIRRCIEKLNGLDPGSVWMDLDNGVRGLIVRRFIDAQFHEGFTACFVSYGLPSRCSFGITRREATNLLRRLGLNPPSTAQVFQLAARTIRTNEVLRIITGNQNRRVAAPVPINPEAAEFLFFGLGIRGRATNHLTGSFSCNPYSFASEYRFDAKPSGDEVNSNDLYFSSLQHVSGHTFPLILGVRPN